MGRGEWGLYLGCRGVPAFPFWGLGSEPCRWGRNPSEDLWTCGLQAGHYEALWCLYLAKGRSRVPAVSWEPPVITPQPRMPCSLKALWNSSRSEALNFKRCFWSWELGSGILPNMHLQLTARRQKQPMLWFTFPLGVFIAQCSTYGPMWGRGEFLVTFRQDKNNLTESKPCVHYLSL